MKPETPHGGQVTRQRTPGESIVELCAVSKSYGATPAVQGVTMELARCGEIHALVGENGAGKSTCLGMAAGRVSPTKGKVTVDGREMKVGNAREFKRAGVHAIYQELTVLPGLTPTANVFLGQEHASGILLRESQMRNHYVNACAALGIAPRFVPRAGVLSVADQQLIEIMRALVAEPSVILFDEPTTSLAHTEREALFRTMHSLRDNGMGIAWVSHNLEEVLEHSDRITVFRDGEVVEERRADQWSKDELVVAMVGADHRVVTSARRTRAEPATPAGETRPAKPLLSVVDLSTPRSAEPISFDLNHGEVLGIAGLVGSGRTSLLRTIAGLNPTASGVVKVDGGLQTRVPKTVREARARGIAMLAEDRKTQGLLPRRSAGENVLLGGWDKVARFAMLRDRVLDDVARSAAVAAGFSSKRMRATANQLSGGNQQKLLIARLMQGDHPVLLADEPTRGVDIGAKAEILSALESVVATGRSLIIVSSEFEELVELCDRVLVLRGGRHIDTFDGALTPITVKQILTRIFDDTNHE